MKKFLLPACIGAIVTLSACGGNPPEAETTAPAQPFGANTAPAPVMDSVSTATGTPALSAPATTQAATTPNTQAPQPVKMQTQQVPAKISKSTAGLNPAHGQPGHRCDIEVGAPLSSAPKQVQQSVPTTAAPTTPIPTTNGSVKLNPAHGQPGHDCAVAVGQPLKDN